MARKKKTSLLKSVLKRVATATKRIDYKQYAEEAADRIKRRTRSGFGVDGGDRGASRFRLSEVIRTDQYNRFRKKTTRLNRGATSPARHNLTLTGQLLNSMFGYAKGKYMVVQMRSQRTGKATNNEIIGYQSKLGRDFFELTDKEVKGLRNLIKKDLIRMFKKTK